MIQFKQKEFTEYDAMRSLYVRIMELTRNDRNRFPVINTSSLIPILKGNNIVIERFVISTSVFGKDVYRMYLKIGARAKLPDEVRLPGNYYDKKLMNASLSFEGGLFGKNAKPNEDVIKDAVKAGIREAQGTFSETPRLSLFSKTRKKGGGGGGGDQQKNGRYGVSKIGTEVSIQYQVKELLGEAIKYDKRERSLVLEFPDIDSAIHALNILPFGLNYKIYLLDA